MVAGVPLRLPEGTSLHALSDAASETLVRDFVAQSPERTLYHEPGYIDFARDVNGRADLIVLARDGNPLVGMPFHPQGVSTVSTGYAGILLPPVERTSAL